MPQRTKKMWCTSALLLAALTAPVQAEMLLTTTGFDRIVSFGDSLSDTGLLHASTGGMAPPAPAYAGGRFSNGPVWTEYLATELNIGLESHAWGGSTTGTGQTDLAVSYGGSLPTGVVLTTNLQTQVDDFVSNPASIQSQTLYTVYSGANDVFTSAAIPGYNPADTAGNIATAITKLADASTDPSVVDVFVVPNLPSLGQTPLGQQTGPLGAAGLDALTVGYNTALAAYMDALDARDDVVILEIDVYSLFLDVQADPAKYNLTDVMNPWLTVDPTTFMPLGELPGASGDADDFLFYDKMHPTTGGHSAIAKMVNISLAPLIPEPGSFALVAAGSLAMATRRRRPRKWAS